MDIDCAVNLAHHVGHHVVARELALVLLSPSTITLLRRLAVGLGVSNTEEISSFAHNGDHFPQGVHPFQYCCWDCLCLIIMPRSGL
jgi:hypothetical protein